MMRGFHFEGFDVDGTLIDSRPAVVDRLRQQKFLFADGESEELVHVLSPLPLDEFRWVLKMQDDALCWQFRRNYGLRSDSVSYKLIQPMSGVFEALSYRAQKVGPENMFVLTNRQLESAEAILAVMKMGDFFEVVAQAPTNTSLNPKIDSLAGLLSQRRTGERGLYVGDHIKDAEAAIANGLKAFLVGLNSKEGAVNDGTRDQIATLETLGQFALILERHNESGC